MPQHFHLSRGYPNPFRDKIGFQLTARKNEKISVSIFNLLGQRVKKLQTGNLRQNLQRLWWDGKNDAGHRLPAGIYILRARSAGFMQMRKILLLR
jgi:flagellar hook assembly protein FlgD